MPYESTHSVSLVSVAVLCPYLMASSQVPMEDSLLFRSISMATICRQIYMPAGLSRRLTE